MLALIVLATVILTLSSAAVTFVVSVLLPAVNGVAVKLGASNGVKIVVSMITAAVAALIVQATVSDGSAIFSTQLVQRALFMYAVQLLTYLGLYKPLAVDAHLFPEKGLG